MTQEKNNPIKLRTIFMGTSDFSESILQALISAKYNVVSVYTQPDKKVGRKQELVKSAVKNLAEKNKIPVFDPVKFDAETIAKTKEQKPDLIIVAAYGRILPKEVLELPGFGAINLHTSLLPAYRGPSPIQNAILNGEKTTGVTMMLMNAGVDTGDILAQKELAINEHDTTPNVSANLAKLASSLLLENIPLLVKRDLKPKPQDNAHATLCQLIERTDGKIMWSDEAEAIYNRYRAFYSWPGIYTFWENNEVIKRIKLNKISLLKSNPETKHHIGEVFLLGEDCGVQTLLGVIILQEVQLEGKDSVTIREFLNGYPNFVGSILK